jgi:simple sugar transport system ATP-binding protein
VADVADRVTVLRRGEVAAELAGADITHGALVESMIGESGPAAAGKAGVSFKGAVLRLESVCVPPSGAQPGLSGVTFAVRSGEILAVSGVADNGEECLADVVCGLERPSAGAVYFDGVDVTDRTVRWRLAAGLALIPDDPAARALVGGWTLAANRLVGRARDSAFVGPLGISRRRLRRDTQRLIDEYGVRGTPRSTAAELSGGNRQRFVVARELSRPHRLIAASNPTKGLDVAASRAVRDRLVAERTGGAGVLLISQDLDEVIEIADRAVVLFRGRISEPVTVTPKARSEIGRLMVGVPALASTGPASGKEAGR